MGGTVRCMFSKRNFHELNKRQQPIKQRFTLKKLTIGVASVLIGFAFLGINESAKADVASSLPSTDTVTSSSINGMQTASQKTENAINQLSADSLNTSNQVTNANTISVSNSSVTSSNAAAIAVNETSSETTNSQQYTSKVGNTSFVSMGDSFTTGGNGQTTPDLNGNADVIFGNGDGQTTTTKIAYHLQGSGSGPLYYYGSGSGNIIGYPGKGEYILYTPTGFEIDTSQSQPISVVHATNHSQSVSSDVYQTQILGTTSTGQQAILVTFNFVPYYGNAPVVVVDLKLKSDATPGTYQATDDLIQLVDNNDGSFADGSTSTVTINGTSYTIVNLPSGIPAQNNTYTIGNIEVAFTGAVSSFPDGNSNNLQAGDTTTITYAIQNNTGGSLHNSTYYPGSADYLLIVPQGFTASDFQVTNSSTQYPNGTYDNNFTYLGTNSEGQQVYKFHTNVQPGWNGTLFVKANLTAQAGNEGKAYQVNAYDLVKAIDNGNYDNSSTSTITLSDGSTLNVINSTYLSPSWPNSYTYGFNAVQKQTFTGTTQWAQGNNQDFAPGDTSTITYKIQGYGEGSNYSLGQGQYLLYIPQGFSASSLTIGTEGYGANHSDINIENLGNVGGNGQQVWLVTVGNKPMWNNPLYLSATITANADAGGGYSTNTSNLIKAVVNNDNFTGDTTTVTYNGITYAVTNTTATANGSSDSTNNTESYNYLFPNVGKTEIASDDYSIPETAISAKAVNTSTISNIAGYEELDISNITFKEGSITNGSYLDFRMGLPSQDNGLVPYDTVMSPTSGVFLGNTQIGTLYQMNGFYRLVFNAAGEAANQSARLVINNLSMKWNHANSHNSSAIPTVKPADNQNNPDPMVYQYTDDEELNDKTFTYTPTNDILIGSSKTYTSGLSVVGQYIYRGFHSNQNTSSGVISLYGVRTWTSETQLAYTSNWTQQFQVWPDTNKLGNTFSVTLKLPVPSDDAGITYNPISDTDIANQIKEQEAKSVTLSNELTGSGDKTYITQTLTANNVEPTVTSSAPQRVKDADGKEYIEYTWNISLPGDEPVAIAGGINLLNVTSTQPFTVPDGVTTYSQDKAKYVSQGSYSGNDTGNITLLNTLENLGTVASTISSTNLSTPITSNLTWGGLVSYDPNIDVSGNSGNASQQTDADLYNPQGGAMWVWSDNWNAMSNLSSADGVDIRKTSLSFRNGFAKSGSGVNSIYEIMNAVKSNGPLKAKWNLTGFVPGLQTADVTITYPDGSTDTTTMQVLVLQEPAFIRYNQVRPDEAGQTNTITATDLLGNMSSNDETIGQPIGAEWVNQTGPTITSTTQVGRYDGPDADIYVQYNSSDLNLVGWPKDGKFKEHVQTIFITTNLQTTVSRGEMGTTAFLQDTQTNQLLSTTVYGLNNDSVEYVQQANGTLESSDGAIYGMSKDMETVTVPTLNEVQNVVLSSLVNLTALSPADYSLSWNGTPQIENNQLKGIVRAQLSPTLEFSIPVIANVQIENSTDNGNPIDTEDNAPKIPDASLPDDSETDSVTTPGIPDVSLPDNLGDNSDVKPTIPSSTEKTDPENHVETSPIDVTQINSSNQDLILTESRKVEKNQSLDGQVGQVLAYINKENPRKQEFIVNNPSNKLEVSKEVRQAAKQSDSSNKNVLPQTGNDSMKAQLVSLTGLLMILTLGSIKKKQDKN